MKLAADRLAAIDIGTNTVKLLVAARDGGKLTPLFEDSQTTRLGEGVDKTSRLLPEAIERTAACVAAFAARARQLGASSIRAVATSSARDGENRDDFVRRVRELAGIEVEVISGEREAELIFAGVCSNDHLRDTPLLVMDVGGGSAEFIVGRRGRLERRCSVHAGAVRMTERFLHSDPVAPAGFDAMMAHLRGLMEPALAQFDLAGRAMLGTGGTITTAAAMDLRLAKFSVEAISNHPLSLSRLETMLGQLRGMTLAERRQLPGLPAARADIIIAGVAAFVVAMELARQPSLTVSTRGLRFGLLARTGDIRLSS
jgi:exopolyphosphatase/guanosine-5'-triphosphate,3'-diphosphate pyrophosphatase